MRKLSCTATDFIRRGRQPALQEDNGTKLIFLLKPQFSKASCIYTGHCVTAVNQRLGCNQIAGME
jgi:hypothetical protein